MVLEVIGDIPQLEEQIVGHYLIEVLAMNENIVKQVRDAPLTFSSQPLTFGHKLAI